MVEAVAAAPPRCRLAEVRRAVMLAGELGAVARAGAHARARPGSQRFAVELFRPLQPMLAQPAEDVAEALAGSAPPAFEWKLDGARVQVHKDGRRGARLHAQPQRRHRRASRSWSRPCARLAGARADPRRRGDRPAPRRLAAPVPGHHAPLRPQARCRRACARSCRCAVLLRLPATATATSLIDRPAGERFAALARALPRAR